MCLQFVLHMHYPSTNPASTPYPLMVTVRASMIRAQDPQPRFNITGDKGSYIKFGLDPQEGEMRVWKPESGRTVGDDKWGYEEEGMWGDLQTNQNGKLVKEKYGQRLPLLLRILTPPPKVPIPARSIPRDLQELIYRHPRGQGSADRQAGAGGVDDENHRVGVPEFEGGEEVEG